MSVVVEPVPHRHALLITLTNAFDKGDEGRIDQLSKQVWDMEPGGKLFHIVNLTYAQRIDYEAMVALLKAETTIRSLHLSEYEIELLVVIHSEEQGRLAERALKALKMEKTRVFVDLRNAYDYIDRQ